MPLERTTIFFKRLFCTSGRNAKMVFRTPNTLVSKLFCVSPIIEPKSCSLHARSAVTLVRSQGATCKSLKVLSAVTSLT